MFINDNNDIHGPIDFVNLFQLKLLSIGTFSNVLYYYYNTTVRLVFCPLFTRINIKRTI